MRAVDRNSVREILLEEQSQFLEVCSGFCTCFFRKIKGILKVRKGGILWCRVCDISISLLV